MPGVGVVVLVALAVLGLQVSGLLAGGVVSRGPARTAARSGLLSVASPSHRSPGTGLPAIEAGLLPWQLAAPISREVVLPAPANQLLIVGGLDGAGASVPGIFSLATSDGRLALGRVLYRYQPTSGPGVLNHPSLVELLPSGAFMLNDDYNNRMVAIDPVTGALVWQYGVTGGAGNSLGHLNTPDGFDVLGPSGATPTHPATG